MEENYHFIGIGGIGMSGLARIMLSRKIQVSGSDISSSAIIEALSNEGAQISIGHTSQNIPKDSIVVFTTDIKKENPEYQAAISLKCPMLHRSELLQRLMQDSHSLAVAGTHGKTTTSSLLTWVLEKSGLSPSYAIGGVIPQLKHNAAHGTGKYFVAEACESDGTFLNYTPSGAIVTNIDLDHMDFYETEAALLNAFKEFMSKVSSSEFLFWCGDDPRLKQLAKREARGISYGFSEDCILRASNFKQQGWMIHFDIEFNGEKYRQVQVSLIGKHNALNALAVFGKAISLGIEESKIREALRTFDGVKRRCEKKGEDTGILFLDDYGHHPTEIRATLKGIRQAIGERRLVVAYQPHRYSRAKECMGLYQEVFEEADELFVTEIYAAREHPIPGVTHEKIISEIQKELMHRCQYVNRSELASTLSSFLRPHDVLVTLGAGDVTKVAEEVLTRYRLKAPQKLKVGVVMGGRSVEHEVSLLSSENILATLRPEYYEVEHFGITRQGCWITGSQARQRLQDGEEIQDIPTLTPDVLAKLLQCDIIFPILHGPYGEDGTIQGFFEILGLPYVGCDHRSASISMDKRLTKILLVNAGISTSPFISFSFHEWLNDPSSIVYCVKNELHFPVFVKATHLGSSIGVYKVTDEESLVKSIEEAFRFDTHLIIENGIEGREIEFAVIGNDQIVVFPPGEILTGGHIYDYEGKYSKNGTKTAAKADLSPSLIEEGKSLVKRAYLAARCTGMARIDTFLDEKGKFWINEINPIPGFTKNSLYPQMCSINGFEGTDLIDRLIVLGLERKRKIDRLEIKPF